jgi:Cdc6-like AAA superfamily ATPase
MKTNTILIGIANSVDLPFKKKHSAIAMRDAQLLFEPYSEEQIIEIIEFKTNYKFKKFPLRLKSPQVKPIFFELLDEKAKEIIAKKVSKMNGDVRVAFDILKSCFVELYNRVKYFDKDNPDAMPEDNTIKVTFSLVLKVFNDKYASKLPEILRRLPRQNLLVLEAIVNLYQDFSEDKRIGYKELLDEVEYLCKSRGMMDMIQRGSGVAHYMDDL